MAFQKFDYKTKYVNYLVKEIEILSKVYDTRLDTIYFGGGTPSFLDTKDIAKIIDSIKSNFKINKGAEITFECNPEDANIKKLNKLKLLGFNRISIGVQSFFEDTLCKIGRKLSLRENIEACKNAREAGFSNLSLDIMCGILDQEGDKKDLELLEKYISIINPEHISVYTLILHKGTKLHASNYKLPKDEDIIDSFSKRANMLLNYNYKRYEISNFSKEGFESRHNLSYWNMKEGLGAGMGAVYTREGFRAYNTYSFSRYFELIDKRQLPLSKVEKLTKTDIAKEYLMMGLRLTKGINTKEFKNRFNINILDKCYKTIENYKKYKLIEIDGENLYLTTDGFNLSNTIISDLFLCFD